ncbi:hypothetical protein [Actinokineospora pegani]|uniref:hypothetical protein n=1 Tax=Actinokineospora pegani TaxID=2654637 RepID=UPI001F41DD8E|nr:hypothetical protein [Actinokineospora pegani]
MRGHDGNHAGDETEPEEGARGWATTLTGAAALFVLLRLLAVAHYDWHTAFALLHTLDFEDAPAIFLGTFMANRVVSTVLLVGLTSFTLLAWTARGRAGRRGRAAHLADPRRWLGPALLTAVLIAMVVAHIRSYRSWGLLVAVVLLALVVPLLGRVREHPRLGRVVSAVLRQSKVLVIVAALVCAAVVSTPWVPLERVEVEDGTREVHVFDVSPGFVKVLDADTREFHIYREDEIRTRVELADH